MFQLYVLPHSLDIPRFVVGSGVINFSAITGTNFILDCSWRGNPNGSLQFTSQGVGKMDNVVFNNTSQYVAVEGA